MTVRFAAKPVTAKPEPKPRAFDQIKEALTEALSVAKGEASPHREHKSRGRPPSGKTRVTLLLDPDVIARFKATGLGWQRLMNDALKAAKV